MDLHIVLVDHLLKTKNNYKNIKKQNFNDMFTKKKLYEACLQHDLNFGDFKDFHRRKAADKL